MYFSKALAIDPLVFGILDPFECLNANGFLDGGLDLFFLRNLFFSINFLNQIFVILKILSLLERKFTLTSKKIKLKFYFLKIITLSMLNKSFNTSIVVNCLSSKIFFTFLLCLFPTSTQINPSFLR